MRALATQSASGNTGTTDRTALQAEFSTLQAEVNRIVGDTTYQGSALIDGSYASKNFKVGTTSGSDSIALTIATTNASALGLDAAAVSIGTVTAASTALASIIATSNTVLATVIGQIGAAENRVGYASSVLATRAQNVSAAEATIRDVNVAQETTIFTKNQVLAQAGTAMLAQANQLPQSVLKLLQ
jgi:flagellin